MMWIFIVFIVVVIVGRLLFHHLKPFISMTFHLKALGIYVSFFIVATFVYLIFIQDKLPSEVRAEEMKHDINRLFYSNTADDIVLTNEMRHYEKETLEIKVVDNKLFIKDDLAYNLDRFYIVVERTSDIGNTVKGKVYEIEAYVHLEAHEYSSLFNVTDRIAFASFKVNGNEITVEQTGERKPLENEIRVLRKPLLFPQIEKEAIQQSEYFIRRSLVGGDQLLHLQVPKNIDIDISSNLEKFVRYQSES